MTDPLPGALDRFFGLDRLVRAPSDANEIRFYYRVMRSHDRGKAVLMGLRLGNTLDPDELKAQAASVDSRLTPETRTPLEPASGRGKNSLRLARRHPEIGAHRLDRTPAQFAFVRRDGAEGASFAAVERDYRDLSRYESGSIDLVFVVGALCHSDNKPRVGAEAACILRPGGPSSRSTATVTGLPKSLATPGPARSSCWPAAWR